MGKRGYFRKKLRQEDEFISTTGQLLQFVRDNPGRTAFYLAAVVLIVAVVLGTGKLVEWRRGKVASLTGEADLLYQAAKDDPSKIAEAERKLQAAYDEYPGTVTGQVALYHEANLLYREGAYQKALEKYRLLAEKHADNEMLLPLALRGMAYASEQANDLHAARAALERLRKAPGDLPKPELLMDLARVAEKLEEKEKAASYYKEIVASFAGTPWAGTAREKLGLPPEKEEGK